jgi:hypothetical protein
MVFNNLFYGEINDRQNKKIHGKPQNAIEEILKGGV